MSDALRYVPFTTEMLSSASVQAFDCGSAEWETEISAWLKAPAGTGGAVDELADGSRIWLYITNSGELVGVGGLADDQASWPKNSSPLRPASCITWLAVDVQFRRKGYGQQILDHLLAEARLRADKFQLVVLYVHTANTSAADWYKANQFIAVGKPKMRNGREYQRMVLNLVPADSKPPKQAAD